MSSTVAAIPEDVVDALDRDGAICLRGRFGPSMLELAAEGIRRNLEKPSPMFQRFTSDERGAFFSDMWARRQIPEFERFARESPSAAIAAQCLRCLLYTSPSPRDS